jgi:hypothetical protein
VRRCRVGAQDATQLETAHAREHHIQNGKIDRLRLGVGEGITTGGRDVRGPAGLLKVTSDQLGDVGVVFGDEDRHSVQRLSHAG